MEDIAKGSLAPTEAFFFSLLQHEVGYDVMGAALYC